MKIVSINLYSFDELNDEAKEKAMGEHSDFLGSELVDYEDEAGQMRSEYFEYSKAEVIDNILANDYVYFFDGSLANCTTYCGKHPKAGITELTFKKQVYQL